MVEKICGNCKFLGALMDQEELVCGRTNEFRETVVKNTCESFKLDEELYEDKKEN